MNIINTISKSIQKYKYKLLLWLVCSIFDTFHKQNIGSWSARAALFHEIDNILTLRSYKQQGRKAKQIWQDFTKTND